MSNKKVDENTAVFLANKKELPSKRRRELYAFTKEENNKRCYTSYAERRQANATTKLLEFKFTETTNTKGSTSMNLEATLSYVEPNYQIEQNGRVFCRTESKGMYLSPFEVLATKDIMQKIIVHKVLSEPHMLKAPDICKYCYAKKFERECCTFCCDDGKIKLCLNAMPDDLFSLFTQNFAKWLEFRCLAQSYNNHFAFTSLGVKYDKDLCKMDKGVYTFKKILWICGMYRQLIRYLNKKEQ